MFEQASRLKIRFESPKGLLPAEDLWDLPLTSTTGRANLDDIAKALHRELRDSAETVSFVTPTGGTANTLSQLRFDLVKHVIGIRVEERAKALDATKRAETKQRLLEIISRKENETLEGKSLDELRAMAETL